MVHFARYRHYGVKIGRTGPSAHPYSDNECSRQRYIVSANVLRRVAVPKSIIDLRRAQKSWRVGEKGQLQIPLPTACGNMGLAAELLTKRSCTKCRA